MTRQPLTDRQLAILVWVLECFVEGMSPTMREIGDWFGISSESGVRGHLIALERKGWIVRKPGQCRAIMLPEPPAEMLLALRKESNGR